MRTKIILQSGEEKNLDLSLDIQDQLAYAVKVYLSHLEPDSAALVLSYLSNPGIIRFKVPVTVEVDHGFTIEGLKFNKIAGIINREMKASYLLNVVIQKQIEIDKAMCSVIESFKEAVRD